jgi:nicotinamidase-related amidase
MKRCLVLVTLVVLLLVPALTASAVEKPAPPGMKPALVVMDVQNAWLPYMDEQDKKIGMEHINWAINLFRDNGFPVIVVYHTDPENGPAPGTEAFEFPKTVAIRADDPKVVKNYGSAFKKTELDRMLKERGVNTVFLVGLSAVGCVLATYHGGDDLDYKVFMVKHALISHDAALTKSVYDICANISPSALKLLLETARAQ